MQLNQMSKCKCYSLVAREGKGVEEDWEEAEETTLQGAGEEMVVSD
jgi:hypothetical protein